MKTKTKSAAPAPHGNKTALVGNRNALRHGLRSFEQGKWPSGSSYAPRITGKIAIALRDEMTRMHGTCSIFAEAVISSIRTHETRGLLLERMLRRNKSKLPLMDQVEILKQIGNARDARDKKLQLLGLSIRGDDGGNIWDAPTRKLPAPENEGGDDDE